MHTNLPALCCCPYADTLSTTYDSMCCTRPEKPPKAAAGGKGGKGRGGKQAAAAGRRRGRPAGGGGAARKRQRRRSEWSSSSEEEEEEEESEEEAFSDAEEDEVVILDSEEEVEEAQRRPQQPQLPASGGKAQQMADDSEGEGWSSDECGGSPAGGAPAGETVADSPLPPTQPQEGAAAEREQGPAQPLPPAQQQQGEPAAAGGQQSPAADHHHHQQQQQQFVPTAVLKRTGATLHKEQVGAEGNDALHMSWPPQAHHLRTTLLQGPCVFACILNLLVHHARIPLPSHLCALPLPSTILLSHTAFAHYHCPVQVGKPGEEQLKLWGHHSSTATVPVRSRDLAGCLADASACAVGAGVGCAHAFRSRLLAPPLLPLADSALACTNWLPILPPSASNQDQVMQQIGDEWVSFVFSLQVDGRPVDPEPPLAPLAQHPGVGAPGGPARRPGGVRPGMAAAAAAGGGVQRPAAAAAVAVPQQMAAVAAPAAAAPGPVPAPAPAPASKENAASNAAVAAGQRIGSRLALPQRPKPAAAPAAAKVQPQRAAVIISDSEDDFK